MRFPPDRRRPAVGNGVDVGAVTQERLDDGQPAGDGRRPQRRHRVADALVRNVKKTPLLKSEM